MAVPCKIFIVIIALELREWNIIGIEFELQWKNVSETGPWTKNGVNLPDQVDN